MTDPDSVPEISDGPVTGRGDIWLLGDHRVGCADSTGAAELRMGDIVAAGLAACGLQLRAQIVWVKQHFTLSGSDYHWKHKTRWYAAREQG